MTISKIGGASSNLVKGTINQFRTDVYHDLCQSFGPLARVEQTRLLTDADIYNDIREELVDDLGLLGI